ncbi:MAG: hypothetical protein KDI69_01685 [Xanthomonadales bacterium]|nr:hypothetical protein [Xanthomonadales bacterium]
MKILFPVLATLALAACGSAPHSELPTETVVEAPLDLSVIAEGRLRSVEATPLLVPGRNWTQQQLSWMVPDGSQVKRGEVIARFSAAQGELNLTQALLDIERTKLTRQAKEDALEGTVNRVGVDLAQVGSALAIANRYADADLDMFARNEILDAIEDQRFLKTKDGTLRWQLDQASERGAAELGVIDAQAASFQHTASLRQQDLDSLELIAPHDGVLMLTSNWSGEKPTLGQTMWARNEFGSLPDISSLELEISVPQVDALNLAKGMKLSLYPLGHPEQRSESDLSFVATAAQVESRDSPVRYLKVKAAVDTDAVKRFGWVPGMAFRAELHLASADSAISVANVAVESVGADQHFVYVMKSGVAEKRAVEVGDRGPARTRILSGLTVGDRVILLPEEVARKEREGSAEVQS